MTPEHDRISREDLALIIQTATDSKARRLGGDDVDRAGAERIAAEVGIEPAEFRAAARALKSKRLGTARLLGPAGVMSAEDTLPRPVTDEEACQLLAEGQLSMPIVGAGIETSGGTVWRLGERGRGELQVAMRGDSTRLAASLDHRRAKLGMLAASTVAGGMVGSFALAGAAFVALGSPEALATANMVGVAGGSLLGFLGGRTAWRAFAKRSQEKVFSALERMRALAGMGDTIVRSSPLSEAE